jgi:hypothetical protein
MCIVDDELVEEKDMGSLEGGKPICPSSKVVQCEATLHSSRL